MVTIIVIFSFFNPLQAHFMHLFLGNLCAYITHNLLTATDNDASSWSYLTSSKH